MLKVMMMAGEYAAEAVWHRVVLLITNPPEVGVRFLS